MLTFVPAFAAALPGYAALSRRLEKRAPAPAMRRLEKAAGRPRGAGGRKVLWRVAAAGIRLPLDLFDELVEIGDRPC